MSLKVNGRYLYEDGRPFFWLGDTAWLLFEKLTPDEIKYYLDDRAKKGFNVIQATVLHTLSGVQSGKTACGQYFDKILNAINYAKKLGVYFALLPCWGDFVKKKIINENNFEEYACFLGEKFKDCKNIIWMLGGDILGSEAPDLYRAFAKILKEYNPERLVTFHPFGRTGSYRWFNDCDYFDFNTFQSGHRRYGQSGIEGADGADFEEDNYKYVREAHSLTPTKPCLDAEPSYESIVQGLHDFSQPYWQANDVRRYAYWSVFAGACGFTYGHNAVMQSHREDDEDANYGVRENWRKALNARGAGQMKYLKELMLSVDFTSGKCRDDLVIGGGEKYGHTACFAGDGFALLYNYSGNEIRLKPPFEGMCEACLFDPKDGTKKYIAQFDCKSPLTFEKRNGDYVIILKKL